MVHYRVSFCAIPRSFFLNNLILLKVVFILPLLKQLIVRTFCSNKVKHYVAHLVIEFNSLIKPDISITQLILLIFLVNYNFLRHVFRTYIINSDPIYNATKHIND